MGRGDALPAGSFAVNDNATRLMLDTSVLGWVCHPRKYADVKLWLRGVLRGA